MAKSFIESGLASHVLLLTADTYSKYSNPKDRSVYPIFGDAATATLISSREHDKINIGPFVFGSDGSGAQNLIIPAGGFREPVTLDSFVEKADEYGNIRNRCNLYMNGPEIFNFTLREIPSVVEKLLEKSQASLDEYDYFVFHQANLFMLEHLRKKLKIDAAKFSIQLSDIGNTVSSSIPIALKRDLNSIQPGSRVMLVGFGVGYSWAACSIRL
ncbi:3-oxoacyl-[acyl-carrier-protein] synthase 3 [compost metagenome]